MPANLALMASTKGTRVSDPVRDDIVGSATVRRDGCDGAMVRWLCTNITPTREQRGQRKQTSNHGTTSSERCHVNMEEHFSDGPGNFRPIGSPDRSKTDAARREP